MKQLRTLPTENLLKNSWKNGQFLRKKLNFLNLNPYSEPTNQRAASLPATTFLRTILGLGLAVLLVGCESTRSAVKETPKPTPTAEVTKPAAVPQQTTEPIVETAEAEEKRGKGPAFASPSGIAFHNGAAYVLDEGLKALVRVDLGSRNRSIVSQNKVKGSGALFMRPQKIAFVGATAYVTDIGFDEAADRFAPERSALLKVSLATGDREVVSRRKMRGEGTGFNAPGGLAIQGSSAYVVDTASATLLEINLATGDRTIASRAETLGSGTAFEQPWAVATRGSFAFVTDWGLGAVVQVELATGKREVVSQEEFRGSGTAFERPASIVFENGTAYLTDWALGAVLRLNLATGDRAIVSKADFRGGGNALEAPADLAFYNGAAYVTDQGLRAVVRMEPGSGSRSIFSR